MFNSKYRKESIENLKKSEEKFNEINASMIAESEVLFNKRLALKSSLEDVEEHMNTISNLPEKINSDIVQIKKKLQNFQEMLNVVEAEVKKSVEKSKVGAGTVAGAAGVAGVGVAVFGPNAAIALATTFGVASTGVPISALSGIAATNAVLAWLGGGALVAGGSGIAGGSLLLMLAGPVGWTVGGVSMVGGGFLKNGENKKAAENANKDALKINAQSKIQKNTTQEITNLGLVVDKDKNNVQDRLSRIRSSFPIDYAIMTVEQKKFLEILISITLESFNSLSKVVSIKD